MIVSPYPMEVHFRINRALLSKTNHANHGVFVTIKEHQNFIGDSNHNQVLEHRHACLVRLKIELTKYKRAQTYNYRFGHDGFLICSFIVSN